MTLQSLTQTIRLVDAEPRLIKEIQSLLSKKGLYKGKIDGIAGTLTQQAFAQFKKDNYLAELELLGPITAKALLKKPVNIPECGIELIKEFEGCHLEAYPDPLSGGRPITIGWGCTKRADGKEWKLGDRLSQEEADKLLIMQLENSYLPALQKIPTWKQMSENRRGALLSFAWNLGASFFNRLGFGSMTRLLTQPESWDNSVEVQRVFCLYCNPGSRVEMGLLRRRAREAQLWLKN